MVNIETKDSIVAETKQLEFKYNNAERIQSANNRRI